MADGVYLEIEFNKFSQKVSIPESKRKLSIWQSQILNLILTPYLWASSSIHLTCCISNIETSHKQCNATGCFSGRGIRQSKNECYGSSYARSGPHKGKKKESSLINSSYECFT